MTRLYELIGDNPGTTYVCHCHPNIYRFSREVPVHPIAFSYIEARVVSIGS